MALNIDLQYFASTIDTAACLTFTGETSDFTLKATNKEWDGTVEYATDSSDWTTWDGSEISSADKKLYLRGSGNTKFYTKNGVRFVLSANAACSGNINTLLQYDNPPTTLEYECYYQMFDGCTSLTQAPALPATTLSEWCYYYMFSGCTSLTQAPALPATTLASNCYRSMFDGCTSLTQAPALPATTLSEWCYDYMFSGCTSLTQAPALPATTLAKGCYYYMFYGCTSLTQAPALPATTLADRCYYYMFSGCTSLTQAPALPATTLASNCYRSMFSRCTSLTQAPALPATTLADRCYYQMFDGCSALKISETKNSDCLAPWRIPSEGKITVESGYWAKDMFSGTGGKFKGTPTANTTYYGGWPPIYYFKHYRLVVPD